MVCGGGGEGNANIRSAGVDLAALPGLAGPQERRSGRGADGKRQAQVLGSQPQCEAAGSSRSRTGRADRDRTAPEKVAERNLEAVVISVSQTGQMAVSQTGQIFITCVSAKHAVPVLSSSLSYLLLSNQ